MPWKLVKLNDCSEYFILPGIKYDIGRLTGHIVVDHMSISRNHATIFQNNENVTIKDLSKFGTFINGNNLKTSEKTLKDGDSIKFGAKPGVDFKFCFDNYKIISSVLIKNDKELLQSFVKEFGAILEDNITETTKFLVMSHLRISFKVILALLKQVPIINIKFLQKQLQFSKGLSETFPQPVNFLPESDDENIKDKVINFQPNSKRLTLFENKKFYFLTKSKLNMLQPIIISGKGVAKLIQESILDNDLNEIIKDSNNLIIYEHELIHSKFCKRLFKVLKQNHKRPIIETEIGYSVLYISIDVYCNSYISCPETIISQMKLSNQLIDDIKLFQIANVEDKPSQAKCEKLNDKIVARNEFLGGKVIDFNPKQFSKYKFNDKKPDNEMQVEANFEDEFNKLVVPSFSEFGSFNIEKLTENVIEDSQIENDFSDNLDSKVGKENMEPLIKSYDKPFVNISMSNESDKPMDTNEKNEFVSKNESKSYYIPTKKMDTNDKNVIFRSLVVEECNSPCSYKTFKKAKQSYVPIKFIDLEMYKNSISL